MDKLFLQIINMSITGSYVILFVIIARLLLKKCPKIFSYTLWSVVLFRLICPFSIEGIFSFIPVNIQAVKPDIVYYNNPQINTGISVVDRAVNDSLTVPIDPGASVNPMQIWIAIGELIWISGIALLVGYSLFSTIKLYRKLTHAMHHAENIYVIKGIRTPFVFGIIKPKIYLPMHLSKKEQEYILLHEQKHISRSDHIIKLIAFFVLCVHWFNPLVWIAFFLMGEDMELSCDESVIKKLGSGIKKEYSSSLLSLSTRRKIVGGCPLAFGENNTKSRIKNVLNYKKPSFWVIVVTTIAVIIVGAGLMLNPKDTESKLSNSNVEPLETNYTTVFMTENENGIESAQINISDTEDINKLYSLIQGGIGSYKNSTVDVPYGKEYIHISFQPSDGLSDYFMYEEDGKYYLVQPYNGKWKINNDLMNEIVTMFTQEANSNDITSATVVDDLITAHFDTIMSKPSVSSNPHDYIKANQSIFDEIVSYGDSALIYCFQLFEQGGQNDLKGHLMMYVCRAIQPEGKEDLGYDTGQMWYDAFKEQAYKLKESNSMDELEKHYPTYYLLLKLLSVGFDDVSGEIRLPNFSYGGNDKILKLVYDTEIEKGYLRWDGFLIPAIHLHGSYVEENKLKVFVTIYDDFYKLYAYKVKSIGGSVIPVAITYTKDENGNYFLDEYVQCQDGARFEPSIKNFCTYPVSGKEIIGLADIILSHYMDYEDLIQLQRSNLIEHLNTHNQTGISLITDYDDSVTPLN